MTQTTSTIDQAEARYDETSEALRAAAPGTEHDEALVEFEQAIEDLRAVRAADAALDW